MTMVLTEEQTLLKTAARDFLQAKSPVSCLRALRDSADPLGYCPNIWQEMAEMGWCGITVPEQYGGLAFGPVGLGSVFEACGRTLAASPLFATVALGADIILSSGTERQKQIFLPKVCRGELTLALALEESDHHSVKNIGMSASVTADGYRLNGSKVFVLDGHSADTLIVLARTNGSVGDYDGLSLFLVDGEAKGVERTRIDLMDSRNAANITFTDVSLDKEALLASIDNGANTIETVLDRARIYLAAEMLGGIQECFDQTVTYLKTREQFGVKIGSFQALKHRAAKMFTEIELCKAVVSAALSAIEENPSAVPVLSSLVKARLSDTALLVTNEAVQMHGGIGVTDELDIGLFLKRARVAVQIFGDAAFHRSRFSDLHGY